MLHPARALAGEDAGEGQHAANGESLLPRRGQPGRIEGLQAGDKRRGGIDDGQHARQPGADTHKEGPSMTEGVRRPGVDAARGGKERRQLRQHERTGDEEPTRCATSVTGSTSA